MAAAFKTSSIARWRHLFGQLCRSTAALAVVLIAGAVGLPSEAVAQDSPSTADAAGAAELLELGVAAYTAGLNHEKRDRRLAEFERAEQLFRQVINTRIEAEQAVSAELWVNLGNAALQAEHVGHAVVAYHRALEMDRDHQQANQNLSFTRQQLPEWAQVQPEFAWLDTLFFWRQLVSPARMAVVASGSFLLAMLLFAASIVSGNTLWRNLAWLPLLCWLLIWSSAWFTDRVREPSAVVVSSDARLYSADSQNSQLLLTNPLPDGTEVKLLQLRERWAEIEIDNRTGWLRRSTIDVLSAPQGRNS